MGYRNVRLSFGLRCSPALLLLALYKILILDVDGDSSRMIELKQLIYQLCYMDNCAVASETSEEIAWFYEQLTGILNLINFIYSNL